MTNILMPGYLYFDGFKYTTSQTIQGPQGIQGPVGPTGPSGTITAGNYVLSAPLSLDGYVTIKYLHTSSGLLSDGYLTLNGLTEVNNDITMAAGTLFVTGNAALAVGSDNAGSFTIYPGVVATVMSDISFDGQNSFNGDITSNGLVTLNDTLTVNHDAEFGNNLSDTLTINSTLNVQGPANLYGTSTFTDVVIDAAGTLTVNVGGSINVDGGIFISSGATFQADGSILILENLTVAGTSSGNFIYNTNTLANSDGYMDSVVDGNILTCASSGGAKTKTITDDGTRAQGSWIILRNTGASDIQVNSPLGGGLSTLASGEAGFFVKMGAANSSWIKLFKTAA